MNNIHYKIKDNPNSSMATKAIAEVSEQSVNDGASNIQHQPNDRDSRLNFGINLYFLMFMVQYMAVQQQQVFTPHFHCLTL